MTFFKRWWSEMNPLVRGLLLVGLFSLVIVLLSLEQSVFSLMLLAQIAFFLAIAFFIFLVWRERRGDIAMWPTRAQWVFYAAAILAVADVAMWFLLPLAGLDAIAFLAVLVICGFSMWRVWRDQRSYA